jgi:hypothetical protein
MNLIVLKSFRAIRRINVELKMDVSEVSLDSIIRLDIDVDLDDGQ